MDKVGGVEKLFASESIGVVLTGYNPGYKIKIFLDSNLIFNKSIEKGAHKNMPTLVKINKKAKQNEIGFSFNDNGTVFLDIDTTKNFIKIQRDIDAIFINYQQAEPLFE